MNVKRSSCNDVRQPEPGEVFAVECGDNFLCVSNEIGEKVLDMQDAKYYGLSLSDEVIAWGNEDVEIIPGSFVEELL